MNKEKYNSLELSIMLFILLNGIVLKRLNIYETVISILISYPIILLFIKKCNVHLNRFINYLIIIFSFLFMILSLINTCNIIEALLFKDKKIIIYILLLVASYLLSKKGLKTIVISSNLLFILYFIILIFIFISNINISNIRISNISINYLNIIYSLIYSFYILFLLLLIPKENIINQRKFKNHIKKVYIIFYIYLIVKTLLINDNILLMKDLNILNVFKSLKEIFVINYLIESYIQVSLYLFCIRIIIKKAN